MGSAFGGVEDEEDDGAGHSEKNEAVAEEGGAGDGGFGARLRQAMGLNQTERGFRAATADAPTDWRIFCQAQDLKPEVD